MSDQTEKTVRTLSGVVISNKMNESVVVRVDRQVKHPMYGKFIRRSTKLHAHDQGNKCKSGDVVLLKECKPVSKTKNWQVLEILESAQ